MTDIVPDVNFIEKNYNKTIDIVKKVCSGDSPLLKLLEDLGERYAICPVSSRKEYVAAFPGGLCYYNLHVLQWLNKLSNLLAPKEFSAESLLKVAILHNVGKVGTLTDDLYIPTKEDWKIKNGTYYDINKKISYMKTSQRSLFFAAHYKVPLTEEEYLAIILAERYDEANEGYKYKEPKLALLLQYATQWTEKVEKDTVVNWP